MDALDLAFALRGCGVSKGDAIKAEAFPKLGESVFEGGPEEPCIVDINLLREPGAQQGLAKEVNVRQQTLIVVELASDLQTAAIVQHVDERQFGLALPEEIIWRGIQLKELADAMALPPPAMSLDPF